MISVVCWKWGAKFTPQFVNVFKSMVDRNLRRDHEVVCVTDDRSGIDKDVRIVDMPSMLSAAPRCIRRMRQYDGEWAARHLGSRILSLDLDIVVVADLDPLFDRPDELVCWKVGYARVYSGAVVLMDAGALHGLWEDFMIDPAVQARKAQNAIYPTYRPRRRSTEYVNVDLRTSVWGAASDQPLLNHYIRTRSVKVRELRDEDGISTYYSGYKPHDPPLQQLNPTHRMVVFGSDNNHEIVNGARPWIKQFWR